jgi:hypothetical protein
VTASNRLVAIVLVVVLAGASAFAVLVSSESPPPSRIVRPSPATSALYVSGDTLLRLDFDSGDVRSIGRTPTSDVFASNSSSWIAYVVSGDGAQGGEDFLAEPVLRTLDPETGASNEIGPGFNPLWHPTAPRFAYLHPIVRRQCSGESCRGLFEVVVYDADTQKSAVLTEPGRFNLLAWSGERVLVANESDLSTTLSLGESRGDVERLDLAPSELWDASPDGRWLLQTASDIATLVDLDSGRERGLAIDRGVLADGAWSPDSDHIVAGVLNEARTKTHAVLIDVSTGDVRAITDELAGILGVTWTSDASQFGFLTFVGGSNRTELNLCSVKDIRCEVVGPPLRRTILLRLE